MVAETAAQWVDWKVLNSVVLSDSSRVGMKATLLVKCLVERKGDMKADSLDALMACCLAGD